MDSCASRANKKATVSAQPAWVALDTVARRYTLTYKVAGFAARRLLLALEDRPSLDLVAQTKSDLLDTRYRHGLAQTLRPGHDYARLRLDDTTAAVERDLPRLALDRLNCAFQPLN